MEDDSRPLFILAIPHAQPAVPRAHRGRVTNSVVPSIQAKLALFFMAYNYCKSRKSWKLPTMAHGLRTTSVRLSGASASSCIGMN
jgi:hypothetical protein